MYSQTCGSFRPERPPANSLVTLLLSTAWVVATASGCSEAFDREQSSASTTASTTAAAITEFDAGVIFGNEASYLCIPLERIGLAADEIRQVTSSCECVRPSVVEYRDTANQTASALRLDFVVEPEGDDEPSAANLAIQISFLLANGATQPFTVQLLHTTVTLQGRPGRMSDHEW
jgi:hypothetical protein